MYVALLKLDNDIIFSYLERYSGTNFVEVMSPVIRKVIVYTLSYHNIIKMRIVLRLGTHFPFTGTFITRFYNGDPS